MKKTLNISIVLIIVLAIGFGIWDSNQRKNQSNPPNSQADSTSAENISNEKLVANEIKANHGEYKDYSEQAVSKEFKSGNKVVLFFHAPWCPYCIAANKAFLNRLEDIPAGITVLKTDYDSNVTLKKKYGVTYQHTFVQINENGDMITKWNGGDIDNLIKYIK